MIHRMRKILSATAAMLCMTTWSSQLFAQIPPSPGPPPAAGMSNIYMPWLVAVGLLAVVCFAAWKGSGRTHQD